MQQICFAGTEMHSLAKDDVLFAVEEQCEHMYFLVPGALHYIHPRSCAGDGPEFVVLAMEHKAPLVSEGQSCCEVGMWCPWVHRGSMMAERASEVLALNVTTFTKITCSFAAVNRYTARYAKSFLELLLDGKNDSVNDMSVIAPETMEEAVDAAFTPHTKSELPPRGDRDGVFEI
eukprot:UN1872